MATMQEIIKKYNLENLGGNDNFVNDKFDAKEWSAPIIQEPQVLKEYLDASGIVGSTIKEIAIVNTGLYSNTGIELNYIDDTNFYIDDLLQPIIIITDKGNFEIDFSESSTIFLSKDSIPKTMYTSNLDFDINKTFISLKGKKIIDFIIKEQDFLKADYDFTNSYDIGLDSKQKSYIKELIFIIENNKKLIFINDFDNGVLYLLDADVEKGFKDW